MKFFKSQTYKGIISTKYYYSSFFKNFLYFAVAEGDNKTYTLYITPWFRMGFVKPKCFK